MACEKLLFENLAFSISFNNLTILPSCRPFLHYYVAHQALSLIYEGKGVKLKIHLTV